MSNPFSNFGAGAVDTIVGNPLFLAGMGAGLFTGAKDWLLYDRPFTEGFVNNPFMKAAMKFREGTTDFFGADDESIVRRTPDFLFTLATMGGGLAAKSAAHGAKQTAKAIGNRLAIDSADDVAKAAANEAIKRNALRTAKVLAKPAKNAVLAEGAMSLVGNSIFGGEDEAYDSLMKAGALTILGAKGASKLRGSLKSTLANRRNITQEVIDTQHAIAKELGGRDSINDSMDVIRDKMAKKTTELVDERGGIMEQLHLANADSFINNVEKSNLRQTAQKIVEKLPWVQKDIAILKKFSDLSPEKQLAEASLADGIAKFSVRIDATKNSILGDMAKEHAQAVSKYKGTSNAPELISLEVINNIKNKYQLDDLIDTTNVKEMWELQDAIHAATQSDWWKYSEKHPLSRAGFIDIDDATIRMQIADAKKTLGVSYDVNPDIQSVLKDMVREGYENGLINSDDFKAFTRNIDNGTYMPIRQAGINKSDDVAAQRTSNIFRVKRGNEEGLGVTTPQNTFKTIVDNFQTTALNAVENQRKRLYLPKLAKGVSQARKEFLNARNYYRNIAKNNGDVNAGKLANHYQSMLDSFNDIKYDLTDDGLQKITNRIGYTQIDYFSPTIAKVGGKGWGEMRHALVPHHIAPLFTAKDIDVSSVGKAVRVTNSMFTSTISGKYNPFFLVKRLMYQYGEIFPALRTELAKQGYDISFMDFLRDNLSEVSRHFKNNMYENMARAVESDDWSLFKYMANGRSPDELRNKIVEYLDDLNVSNVDTIGDMAKSSTIMTINLNAVTNTEKLANACVKAHKNIDKSSVVKLLSTLKSAVDDAGASTIAKMTKDRIIDPEMRQAVVDLISAKTSDTTRKGAGKTFVGKLLGLIQDYTPYGSSTVQGLYGKSRYLNATENIAHSKIFIREALKAHGGFNVDSSADILAKFGQTLAELPDSVMFDMLWKTIIVPTFFCYCWNNMNQEQSSYYHSLKNYEKANRLVLCNFAGNGVNVAVPLDQEWSVVKNFSEAVMDWVFQLGENDFGNPEHSNRDEILWALKQDFGISLPVLGEAAINSSGYKTNLDASVALSDQENAIEPINQHKFKNVDPELATMLMSITGKVGKAIVNLAEDKSVFDFRNAIPFLSIHPHQERTNDTVSLLRTEFKKNPDNPILKKWNYQRGKVVNEMNFYKNNGVTRDGRLYNQPRDKVLAQFSKRLSELDRQCYDEFIS